MAKTIKIVGINGSPQTDGSTAYLLTIGLEQAHKLGAETELIHVAQILKNLNTPFCTNCSYPCKGLCAQGTVLEKTLDTLRAADGLFIGSPVYFGTVSGQLKAFWDKMRCLRAEKALLNTVGGALSTGASRYGGQEGTIQTIQQMMLIQGMTIVGGGQAEHDCGHYGVAAQRPAKEDEQAVTRVKIMAKRIYEVCQATRNLR